MAAVDAASDRPGIARQSQSAPSVTVLKAPAYVRALFGLFGLLAPVFLIADFLASGSLISLLIAPLALPALLEAVRGHVEVDRDAGQIRVRRAYRRVSVPFSSITSVWVPARGPVGLVLRDAERGNSWWRRGEVVTPLYTDNRRAQITHDLARTLHVRVDSPRSAQRWTPPDRSD
jgi:hypothetical protein